MAKSKRRSKFVETHLREVIKSKGYTLTSAREQAGITSHSNFYSYLNGESPHMQDAYALCHVLGCSITDIWPDQTELVEEVVMVKKTIKKVVRNAV